MKKLLCNLIIIPYCMIITGILLPLIYISDIIDMYNKIWDGVEL